MGLRASRRMRNMEREVMEREIYDRDRDRW
jgi:hypothetical protein